jgi:hypothetical protein
MSEIDQLQKAIEQERARFDDWWLKSYKDRPNWLHRQCFEEGFVRGRQSIVTFYGRWISGAAIVLGLVVMLAALSGCTEDHYRYPCQNPDNFGKAECQKPKCLFTQQCPEYLVAPILEKQIEQSKPASEPAEKR